MKLQSAEYKVHYQFESALPEGTSSAYLSRPNSLGTGEQENDLPFLPKTKQKLYFYLSPS